MEMNTLSLLFIPAMVSQTSLITLVLPRKDHEHFTNQALYHPCTIYLCYRFPLPYSAELGNRHGTPPPPFLFILLEPRMSQIGAALMLIVRLIERELPKLT